MTSEEILKQLGDDPQVMHEVIQGLSAGMIDEWDCSIGYALENGLGPEEFSRAAHAGMFFIQGNKKAGVDFTYNKDDLTCFWRQGYWKHMTEISEIGFIHNV